MKKIDYYNLPTAGTTINYPIVEVNDKNYRGVWGKSGKKR